MVRGYAALAFLICTGCSEPRVPERPQLTKQLAEVLLEQVVQDANEGHGRCQETCEGAYDMALYWAFEGRQMLDHWDEPGTQRWMLCIFRGAQDALNVLQPSAKYLSPFVEWAPEKC